VLKWRRGGGVADSVGLKVEAGAGTDGSADVASNSADMGTDSYSIGEAELSNDSNRLKLIGDSRDVTREK